MTDPNAPIDQVLHVKAIHATTDREGDNPPTLHLVLDVMHDEAGVEWTQALHLTRDKWVELMQLLDYAARNEKVKWRR